MELSRQVVLIVEDEPLISLDIELSLQEQGAKTIAVTTLAEALVAVENPDLTAAILDHALGDEDSSILCDNLEVRGIPFVTYSGFNGIAGRRSTFLSKPASPDQLVKAIKSLPTTVER